MYALIPLAVLLVAGCAQEAAAPAASTGGEGGAGGAPGCVDRSGSGSCRFQGLEGGCGLDEVCTVDASAGCGDAPCCTLAPACASPAGARPGGVACEEDGDCAAGLCVSVGGQGICLRPCTSGTSSDSCPDGLACGTVALDAQRSVRTCVGAGEGGAFDAARSLCRHDGECSEGRVCRVAQGERFYEGLAHGLCEPGVRTGETGSFCADHGVPGGPTIASGADWSGLCAEGGLCVRACYDATATSCRCADGTDPSCRGYVCSQPCAHDAECPSPLVCRPLEDQRFDRFDPDRSFKLCVFPPDDALDWACWDETECCADGVDRLGHRCCDEQDGVCVNDVLQETVCRVTRTGAHWTTKCAPPEGLALHGAPCTTHAACASGLCAPEGRCTSPCRPGADDRCEGILPGTQCCPTQVDESCVTACRSDCGSGPGCQP